VGRHVPRFVGATHHRHGLADALRPDQRPERDDRTLAQETTLPTDKLNQCAFVLQGASLDASRRPSCSRRRRDGRHHPGARIQFNGLLGAGAVPDTTFPYFQFIGFAQTETDLQDCRLYNGSGFHEIPSKNFAQVAQDYKMSLAADGSFTVCDNKAGGTCKQKGNVRAAANGTLLSTNYEGEQRQAWAA
jgi:hypothetical protein